MGGGYARKIVGASPSVTWKTRNKKKKMKRERWGSFPIIRFSGGDDARPTFTYTHTHSKKKIFCFRNNKEGNEVSSTHRMMYILCVFVLLLTHSSKHNPSWLWRNNGALFVPTNNYLKTLYGDGLESRSFLSFDDDDDYTHQTVPELIITSKTTFRDAIKYIKLKLKCT